MRPAPHLADQSLLLDLPAELAQRLLELLGIPDDDLQPKITSFSFDCAPQPRLGSVIQKHTLIECTKVLEFAPRTPS